jgi:hypothetical protein
MAVNDSPPARTGPGLMERAFGDRADDERREVALRARRSRVWASSSMLASEAPPAKPGGARAPAEGVREGRPRTARGLIDLVAGMTDAERAELLFALRPAVVDVVRDVLASDLPEALTALLPRQKESRRRKGVRR